MRLIAALLASTFAAAAAGQVQLLPAGEFAARDGRPGAGKHWTLSEQRGQELAIALSGIAAKTPIVIDYDHRTLYVAQSGGRAEAAGWIKSAEWRSGEGLFATVEWTAAAALLIKAGEYRYISPVILSDPDTHEIKGVAMAALLNYPALLGMDAATTTALAALTHDVQEPPMSTLLIALAAALGANSFATDQEALTAVQALRHRADAPPKAALPAALATALGIQAGADEAQALSAVAALKAPDTTTVATVAALQGQVVELTNRLNADKLGTLVDGAISAKKLLPAQRDWAMNLGKQNLDALSTFLAAAPVIEGLGGQSTAGGHDPTKTAANTDVLGGQVASAFGLTAEQFALGAPKKAA